MNTNDRERLAKDSIAQLIYSLPSNYYVGFAAYNTSVVSLQDGVNHGLNIRRLGCVVIDAVGLCGSGKDRRWDAGQRGSGAGYGCG